MNKSLSLILASLFLLGNIVIAQKKQKPTNPFQMVKIPENISSQLETRYKEITGYDSVNAGKNVWNLLEPKNFVFKEGIYTCKGQGPHFPRIVWVYKKEKLFVLNAIGAFNPLEVINEYTKCVNELKLSDIETVQYLKAISLYLSQEQGQTYGREFKKSNANN